MASQAKEGLNV